MPQGDRPPLNGVVEQVSLLARQALRAAQTRIDLLGVEMRAEADELLKRFAWLLIAIVAGGLAALAVLLLAAVSLTGPARVAVLLTAAGSFVVVGVWAVLAFQQSTRRAEAMFHRLSRELALDQKALTDLLDREDATDAEQRRTARAAA